MDPSRRAARIAALAYLNSSGSIFNSYVWIEVSDWSKDPLFGSSLNQLILGDQSVPFDHCLWNTTAAAPEWLRDTELPLDKLGFVQVEKDLSVKGHPNIFVAGDSAALNRPKAGVFAVRAGPVLAQNLRRRIQGKSTLPWRIQRRWLAILNLGRAKRPPGAGRMSRLVSSKAPGCGGSKTGLTGAS